MPKFTFKLEPVLQQRRRAEDEKQRDLAKLLRRSMILQNQLRQMQQTIRESKRQLGGALAGTVELDSVGRFARYSGHVTVRAHGIVMELAKLDKLIDLSRAQLLAAVRDRRAMELLRDREYRKWKKQQDRRENARLDELNVQRYAMAMARGLVPQTGGLE